MDTPKWSGGMLLALALCGAALCSAAEVQADPASLLAVEAQVGGTWVRVLGTERKHLVGGDSTNPRQIPDSAPLRLVGELVDHPESLNTAVAFELKMIPPPSDSDKPAPWLAQNLRLLDEKIASPGARWQPAHPEKAVLLCLWVVDGKATKLRALPLLEFPERCFNTPRIELSLDPGDAAGNPVFLLLENGIPASKHLAPDSTAAERLGTLAALGRDRVVAEALRSAGAAPASAKGSPSLLHLCAQAGAIQSVDALLKLGADPKGKTEANDTALHLAARCGRTAAAERLIAAQSPLSAENKRKNTPLHVAAANAHADICRLLIQAGAPVNATNDLGDTPARLALFANCTPAVELLIERKSRFDFKSDGATRALVLMAAQGQRQLVSILLAQHIEPNQLWRDQTALIAASREGHADVVTDLLAAKADPNRANGSGVTPLLAAASRGRTPVVECLLAAGARPNVTGKNGTTPLQAACFAGSGPSVKALLAAGATADQANEKNIRPLTYAVAAGSREAVEQLLAAGAKVDPAATFFDSELTTALAMDADAFLAAALQAGMPIDYRTAKGWSVLQISTLAKAERCTALLRTAGATEPDSALALPTAGQLEKRPQLLELPLPLDPRDPDESDLKGETVLVDAVIDKDGTTAFARAICQDCRLSQSAVRTVLALRFSPALKDGVPVATQARIPIQFLDPSELAVDFNRLDQKPIPLSQVPPRYPFELKQRGISGGAIVCFIIAPDGSVRDVEVVTATHQGFAIASVEAVKQWRFRPGIRDGKPVATRTQQTFPFSLSQ